MKRKAVLLAVGLVGAAIVLTGIMKNASAFGHRHSACETRGMTGFWGEAGRMGGFLAGKHRLRAMMRQADSNGDGEITRKEATAQRKKRFARFDLDGDGAVTFEEASRAIINRFEGRIKRKLRAFDENGDGRVTLEEFNAPVLERFAYRDTNKDGRLSGDEMPFFMKFDKRNGGFGAHHMKNGNRNSDKSEKKAPGENRTAH